MTTAEAAIADRGALGRGAAAVLFLALALAAGPARAGDDARFVTYLDVPDTMEPEETKTVTVRMLNTGTTTWETSVVTELDDSTLTTTRTSYSLDSVGDDWGVNGVRVTGSVAPNASRDFQFTIKAPKKKGSYTFQWRMARDTVVVERPIVPAKADNGFGARTTAMTIKVEKDTAPAFKSEAKDLTREMGEAVSVTLPEAMGGNGELNYSLSRPWPAGVRFDASTRKLSGKPTKVQAATEYTYTVTDSDANTSASDTDVQRFKIAVVEPQPPDTAPKFKRDVPDLDWEKGKAIRVELSDATDGNGDLNYSLSPKPPEGVTFDDSTRILSGTPTKVQAATEYTYTVTDSDDNTAASDADTQKFKITVTKPDPPDTAPKFKRDVPDLDWEKGKAIRVELSDATGGNGDLNYSLSPKPPEGVTFDDSTLILSGEPTKVQAATEYTYTVTDSDASTSASDTDVQRFEITVKEPDPPDTRPVFSETAPDREWVTDEAVSVTLPRATGGNGTLKYSLSPSPPAGVTFNRSTRELSGTPTTLHFATYTYTVTDSDGNRAPSDSDVQTFTITVVEPEPPDTPPRFSGKAPNREWVKGEEISPVTLPGATGGDGELTYALSPPPPAGVTFDASTRTLSGTPAATQAATPYRYTVTDADDNASAADADTAEFTIAVKRPALVLNEASLRVAEGGAGPTLTVRLAARPTGDVTVEVASADTGTVRVSPSRLTFTPADHGAPQPVTVAGVEDPDTEDGSSKIGLRASGGGYDGVAAVVDVTVADDDADTAPEFHVEAADVEWLAGRPIAPVVLPEAFGGNGELTYALSPRPPAGVTFDSSTRTLSGTPAATQNAAEYAYTVTDADDNASAGDAASAEFTIAVKRPALVLSRASLKVEEGAAGATFTVKLAARPTGDVTVAASSADPESALAEPSRLTFTPANHGTPRPVTVTGVGDDDLDDEATVIDLSARGGGYDGLSASVAVTVADDDADTAPEFGGEAADLEWLVGSAIVPVVLPEATGGNGELTYALSPDPPAGVTFEASTRTLSGTPAEARKATVHRYTVTDSDGNAGARDGDTLTFTIASARPALVLSRTSLEVEEGAAGATFTVKLAALPKGDVTVNVTSGDAEAAAAAPSRLTFTTADYGTPRTVTITGVPDSDSDDEKTKIGLSASGGGYDRASASVAVTVTDDDADTAPKFAGEVADLSWERDKAIEPVTLPEASGGDGDLAYALSPRPPAGVTFDPSTRTLSGAPTETQSATEYTYTVADSDDNAAESDTDRLTFAIAVEEASKDDAAFVSFVDVPSTMAAGSKAVVTVRMRNTGTTTWTSAGGYELGSQRPDDNRTWGLSRVPLPSGVAPNGTADFTFTITAPTEVGKHDFRWRMIRGADGWFGRKTALRKIEVEEAQPSDDASFVSYAGVPSTMRAGGAATVTVRMRNTGTTTWTTAGGYELGSQRREDNRTWGLSRVALPADVAPNGTADFTFAVAAPTKVGKHDFRWRMVRGADGWFGRKTPLRRIEVDGPSFGEAATPDMTWARGEPIEAVTLPEAVGGDGALTYSLTPELPEGATFTEATRTLAGTPSELQGATRYTYAATDADGDAAELSFSIRVQEASTDDAAFVSISGLPSKIAAGDSATVTVTMKNTGTTTWTTLAGYALGSQSSPGKDTWGVRRAPLPASVAPNEEVAFEFPITAPETTGGYTFAWRMVRDPGGWFGDAAGDATVVVEDPSFGDAEIPDRTWTQDRAIEALTLPEASGSAAPFTYALTPALPDGVTFDTATRTLSGTPTTPLAETEYVYTATDANGGVATLAFSVTVEAAVRDDAAFVSISGLPSKIAAGDTATVTVTMKNTGTTTWTTLAGYALGSRSPQGKDTWGARRAPLPASVAPNEEVAFEFPIRAPATTGGYGFAWRMVRDPAGWFGAAAGDATVTVEDPSFGDAAIPDRTWMKDVAIETLPLPAASGRSGPFSYALTPSLPEGVAFTESTRTVAGMPATAQAATKYAYTATDSAGGTATLSFTVTVTEQAAAAAAHASTALPPPLPSPVQAPTGAFDMFAYWLPPHGQAVRIQARLGDGRLAPAAGPSWLRSFWRGELWGRKVALLGDPAGERYDIFEETADGLDYWGRFEGAGGSAADRSSWSLDRPFRWMHRHMAVGDAVESPVTGWFLSNRARNRESVLVTTMRLEVLAHHASFAIPAAGGPAFEDVLEVRFWPDAGRAEAHDTFYLARGLGAVYSRRSPAAAAGASEVVEWWAVEKALVPVVPSAPSVPWFDPFSGPWPKTAVVNGNMDDVPRGAEGGPGRSSGTPGWRADSDDAAIARPPAGIDAGPWAMVLRGSGGGGDDMPDAATTTEWIPVEGGTYRLSACMLRESAADNVVVDFDDGTGRDANFADAHLVATLTGAWECRAATKCIPGSVGAVRVRAVRDGANVGDAWFDGIELKRVAACEAVEQAPRP